MKKLTLFILISFWLFWCTALFIFHIGTLTPPEVTETAQASAFFIKKTKEQPIQHLVVSGPPYARGLKAGELTKHLLYAQEVELTNLLSHIFPSQWLFTAFELAIIPFFKGIEKNIPRDYLLEMYGVSKSSNKNFDVYAEPYTRQLAYHGLHEVGQMMVDQYKDDRMDSMGCTAVLALHKDSWIIGRNFDFEGGTTLDEKKILKWVFPDNKYAYVSVIWAGMVGAITAVNEHGIYLSINAAGSKSFNPNGLPSTLLLTQVMDSAKTGEEALDIINKTTTMVTEIFVLLDKKSNSAYRIEKSPSHTDVQKITTATAVTNHLLSSYWEHDQTNIFRRENLTSRYRKDRAEELLKDFHPKTLTPESDIAKILRDKNGPGNTPLHWGNRRAIDPFIANHSVIYNSNQNSLYVSSGPHLTNEYIGYDLKKSFANKTPIFIKTLPKDPEATTQTYLRYKNFQTLIKQLTNKNSLTDSNTKNLHQKIESLIQEDPRLENSTWNILKAQNQIKLGNKNQAQLHYKKALALHPAYKQDSDQIKEALNALQEP